MNLYFILKQFHSGWAYLVITLALVFFLALVLGFMKKEQPSKSLLKISFFTTLAFHIQMVLGFVLYFVSPITTAAMKNMGETMKDETLRLYVVEHPMMMMVAVILITVTNAKIKKVDQVKISNLIMVVLAIACMLAMIPWNVWPGGAA